MFLMAVSENRETLKSLVNDHVHSFSHKIWQFYEYQHHLSYPNGATMTAKPSESLARNGVSI